MNAKIYPGVGVRVVLSERNLRHLLAALEANSRDLPLLHRQLETGERLEVVVQPDSLHYRDREPGLGFEWLMKPKDAQ